MPDATRVDAPPVLDAVEAAVLVHHPRTGEILDGNKRVPDVLGFDVDSIRHRSVEVLSANSDAFDETTARDRIRAAAAGDTQSFEWLNQRPDGTRFWVSVHLEATTIDGTSVVLACVRDVTERKRRERRMSLLYRVLRHNLRNEMNIVQGSAQHAESELTETDPERALTGSDPASVASLEDRLAVVEERLATIEDTASEVAELSDRVAELERALNAEEQVRRSRSLESIIATVDERVDAPDGAALEVGHLESCTVHVDDVFVDALEQLVQNAFDHGTSMDGRQTVEVHGERAENGDDVEITIVDEGPGIPAIETAVLESTSDPSPLEHGSGLGLWVAKWAVEAHGGELVFVDSEERGTSVTVSAPIATSGSKSPAE
jgi:PAS domain S-box-containing protein